MKLLHLVVALLSICFFSRPSFAEESDSDVIIVTATRTAQTANESLAAVSVITRGDIERSQAKSLPELLNALAGIDIVSTGSYGSQTSLFLRGTSSGQTLVMIDGVKIGSATTGAPAWEFLPISQIDRIEVVRGPHSSLYGSDAIGGVIQIFTRKGRGPTHSEAEASLGSHGSREIGAGVSGAGEGTWYNVYAGRFVTDGIDARKPVLEFGTLVDQPDRDGYDNNSFSARFGRQLGATASIDVHFFRASGTVEFDSDFTNTGNDNDEFTQEAAGATLQLAPLTHWNTSFRFGRSLDQRFSFRHDNLAVPSRFDTERRAMSWQNDFVVADEHLLTLGYDVLKDLVSSTEPFDQTSRDNNGAFALYLGQFGRHQVQISARRDDNEQFGVHDTGNAAWGYTLNGGMRITSFYGTGFRAPTFNDLFFPGGFSNPALKPEQSRSIEVGLRSGALNPGWAVHLYRTQIEELIVLDDTFTPQNLGEATIDGIEIEASAAFRGWRTTAAVSLLDHQDDATGNQLPRRAKRSARISLERAFGNTQIGLTAIAQGPRFDDTGNTVHVGGYALLNARAIYDLSRDWQLRGRIDNAFDKEYETISTFNTLRRTYFLTLAYQPK
jgi:vitamin B12 transporter